MSPAARSPPLPLAGDVRLGDEFKSGACHAGQFESSIVLREQPSGVRDTIRRTLPENPSSLSAAIKIGKRCFWRPEDLLEWLEQQRESA